MGHTSELAHLGSEKAEVFTCHFLSIIVGRLSWGLSYPVLLASPLCRLSTQIYLEKAHRQKVTAICSQKPSVNREMTHAEGLQMGGNNTGCTYNSTSGAFMQEHQFLGTSVRHVVKALVNGLSRNQLRKE